MHVNTDLIERGLAALGLDGGQNRLERLARYVSELELWNPAYGLVKAEGDELIIKHILDSLSALPLILRLELPIGRVADLGYGAGLPGILLAIFLPDSRITLAEHMEKRVLFLEKQKALLGLSNVEIVQMEAERTPGPFDLVVFRTLRPFSGLKWLQTVQTLVAPGGSVLAYKGRPANAKAELADLAGGDKALGPLAAEAVILPLSVPFLNEERCAVLLKP